MGYSFPLDKSTTQSPHLRLKEHTERLEKKWKEPENQKVSYDIVFPRSDDRVFS